ncbi:MAG: hypothetical protein ACXQS8_07175 [Candidatus Helarchaeales archaeon]
MRIFVPVVIYLDGSKPLLIVPVKVQFPVPAYFKLMEPGAGKKNKEPLISFLNFQPGRLSAHGFSLGPYIFGVEWGVRAELTCRLLNFRDVKFEELRDGVECSVLERPECWKRVLGGIDEIAALQRIRECCARLVPSSRWLFKLDCVQEATIAHAGRKRKHRLQDQAHWLSRGLLKVAESVKAPKVAVKDLKGLKGRSGELPRWLNFRLWQSPRRKMLELLELKCKRRGIRVFKVRAAGTSKYPSDLLVKRYRQDLKEHDWKGISLGSWSASLEKGSRVNRSGKVQSCGEFFTYKDPPLLVNADLNAAGNVALKAFHYHVRKKNLKASTPNIT